MRPAGAAAAISPLAIGVPDTNAPCGRGGGAGNGAGPALAEGLAIGALLSGDARPKTARQGTGDEAGALPPNAAHGASGNRAQAGSGGWLGGRGPR